MYRLNLIAIVLMLASLVNTTPTIAQTAAKVSLENSGGTWTLTRNGKPYYIHGAGGEASLKLLSESGGNSNRLWGVDEKTEARLNEADQNDISVALGIWLEHERHGFDYSDKAAVARQAELVMSAVRKYKNHPAVLVWGVGNEFEGYEAGDNPDIWKHVEDLCQRIKKEDPNHPTMAVVAEIKESKIAAINKYCPSLDIIGINSYGGAPTLAERYKKAGGTKPYIVTEYGPVGTWEVGKNNIDAIEEPSSSAKADMYRNSYQSFKKDTNLCLGSYAFLWGNKMEGTSTWFGLLLPDGKKLPALDAMTKEWSGQPPKNLCPVIETFELEGPNSVKADQMVRFKFKAMDPEQKILNVTWKFFKEADQFITGGDKQATPPDLSNMIKRSGPTGATIQMPSLGGLYRVYALVDDGVGAAVANMPLRVAGKDLEEPGEKVAIPYTLYDEGTSSSQFAASGWMGEADGIVVDSECKTNPKVGTVCTHCQYNKATGWGGVVWQHPASDWGDKPGGVDLTGAKKLTFWVRGNEGGEKIKFGFGLIGREKPFFDTAKKEMEVLLEKEWKQVTFDLNELDLRRIKSGFFWSVGSNGKPIRFYLDGIKYE